MNWSNPSYTRSTKNETSTTSSQQRATRSITAHQGIRITWTPPSLQGACYSGKLLVITVMCLSSISICNSGLYTCWKSPVCAVPCLTQNHGHDVGLQQCGLIPDHKILDIFDSHFNCLQITQARISTPCFEFSLSRPTPVIAHTQPH